MKFNFIAFLIVLFLFSCSHENKHEISFYHWKSKAEYTPFYDSILTQNNAKTVYMHVMDVDFIESRSTYGDGIFPVFKIQKIDSAYKKYNIIPVVFITNRVFNQDFTIERLAAKITNLTQKIFEYHSLGTFSEIQIDCDWTETTRNAYFEFLDSLQNRIPVSTTIRLHQIKYADKTGVPPVKKGTLMLYNVGDVKDMNSNSILQSSIVSEYISPSTKYPLELNVALPVFSQTVLQNNKGEVRLINRNVEHELLSLPNYFSKNNNQTYTCTQDTLIFGFYLEKGYTLKIEDSSKDNIVESYKLIKNSNLHTKSILFYHLDSASLQNYDVQSIISEL